jgi:uncharacterized protein
MSSEQTLVDHVATIVRSRLEGQGAGHGFDHIQRVWNTARVIQNKTGGDLFVIELAALLHDIGDAKFHGGKERSKEFSTEILQRLGVAGDLTQHVGLIVDNISFRKRDSAEPLSIEGQIVQDADRLDALGAIGIVRTIEFGAAFDQPFYSDGDETQKTGIGHFYEKLFKLRDLMNTVAGRELAKEREAFMHAFIAQFKEEWTGTGVARQSER